MEQGFVGGCCHAIGEMGLALSGLGSGLTLGLGLDGLGALGSFIGSTHPEFSPEHEERER